MAKKTNKKGKKIAFEENLPQNILAVGERVEEHKNIYISQSVYKEIHKFTKNKLINESGGMLIGNVIEEFGKTNIVIQGFIEAKYAEGTPTTLKFTHETWDYVHEKMEEKYDHGQIMGWIHTHPDFGIFLSEYDKFIQENFFKEDYQVAYVVDPIQHVEGFYFWINGRIERCKGYYIFDKTGEKIEIEEVINQMPSDKIISQSKGIPSIVTYVLGGTLIIAVIVFALICMNLLNRMKILETHQENLMQSANQSISYLQQQMAILESEIEDIRDEVMASKPADLSLETDAESIEESNNSSEEDIMNE